MVDCLLNGGMVGCLLNGGMVGCLLNGGMVGCLLNDSMVGCLPDVPINTEHRDLENKRRIYHTAVELLFLQLRNPILSLVFRILLRLHLVLLRVYYCPPTTLQCRDVTRRFVILRTPFQLRVEVVP